MMESLSVVTLVNNEEQYSRMVNSLLRLEKEPFFRFLPVHADKMGWNAATALNAGIGAASSEWVVCVHQDVIFPDSWLDSFREAIARLPGDAAIVGLVGLDKKGRYAGHIKDPHGHTRWGSLPCAVNSLDELLIAIRKPSGLLFDPENPGFLFYGTDICLSAWENGFSAMAIDAPVVHLSAGRTDTPFGFAADWLLGKWGARCNGLIPTTTMLVGKRKLSNLFLWWSNRLNLWLTLRSKRSDCSCDKVYCSDI